MAIKALDNKAPDTTKHTITLTVDGEEMDDPMGIMEFIMNNKEMFMQAAKDEESGESPDTETQEKLMK